MNAIKYFLSRSWSVKCARLKIITISKQWISLTRLFIIPRHERLRGNDLKRLLEISLKFIKAPVCRLIIR